MAKRKDILTTGQVAQICKVAPRTVTKWFDSGQLKGYRIPGSRDRRIPASELLRFMKAHNIPTDWALIRWMMSWRRKWKKLAVGTAMNDSPDSIGIRREPTTAGKPTTSEVRGEAGKPDYHRILSDMSRKRLQRQQAEPSERARKLREPASPRGEPLHR